MRKFLFLLLVLPLCAEAKVPVEDDIIEQTTDADSPYYYPNLLIRFENGDSTLTTEDFHYLYYGYAYQSSYKPLDVNDKMDRVLLLASSLDAENPNVETLDEIVLAANDALRHNPFSPQIWNLLAYAYGALGDKEREKMAFDRVGLILGAINSSGDGLKEKSPKHIIMFDHAYDLLSYNGIAHSKATVISRDVEYIPFVETEQSEGKKAKGNFFDYSRIYWNNPESVTARKRDNRWQFNGLKPKD